MHQVSSLMPFYIYYFSFGFLDNQSFAIMVSPNLTKSPKLGNISPCFRSDLHINMITFLILKMKLISPSVLVKSKRTKKAKARDKMMNEFAQGIFNQMLLILVYFIGFRNNYINLLQL